MDDSELENNGSGEAAAVDASKVNDSELAGGSSAENTYASKKETCDSEAVK